MARADRIVMDQVNGDMDASGHVLSTHAPDKNQKPGTSMLDTTQPMQASAEEMHTRENNSQVAYRGRAVMWQGANRISADRIDVDRDGQSLHAVTSWPTFQVQNDEETGQTIIKGMGELHLEILVDRMRREFKVEANVGKPQVAYRETIKRVVEREDLTYKKQTGGSGQYAKVQIGLEPLALTADGPSYEFENKVTGGRIPQGVHPVGRRGRPGSHAVRHPRRLPAGRRQDDAARRRLPRRRLLRDGVQDRRLDGVQGRGPQGEPGPARADDGRRGHHARGQHGRRHRRPQLPPWPDPGHGGAQRYSGRQGARAAVGDVRLRRRPAVARPRAGRATRCSSTAMPRFRRTWRRRSSRRRPASSTDQRFNKHQVQTAGQQKTGNSPKERDPQWRRRSSSGPSRTSTSAPSVTSTMARRR